MSASLTFGLIICTPPHTDEMSYLAWQFARTVIAGGHQLKRVFFYEDGVYHANCCLAPASDEVDLHQAWIELARLHTLTLEVCTGASSRRGILAPEEAHIRGVSPNLSPTFTLSGAGQLAEIALTCDRVVQFKS